MSARLIQFFVGCGFIGFGVFAFLWGSDMMGYEPPMIVMLIYGACLGGVLTWINRTFWSHD